LAGSIKRSKKKSPPHQTMGWLRGGAGAGKMLNAGRVRFGGARRGTSWVALWSSPTTFNCPFSFAAGVAAGSHAAELNGGGPMGGVAAKAAGGSGGKRAMARV
jgi:hypothetical protein